MSWLPRALRTPALAVLVAVLASGCMGPTYYLSGVSGMTTLEGAWDARSAEAAFMAAGLQPVRSADRVVVTDAANSTTLILSQGPEGGVEYQVSVVVGEEVGPKEAAERRADEVIAQHGPRAEDVLAKVENATGWMRRAPLQWGKGILHGD